MRRAFIAIVVAMGAVSAAYGAEAANQTTPKGTVKVFAQAVQAGRVDAVRGCLHTTSATEEKFAQGYADVSVGMAKLRQALMAKFGDQAADALGGAGRPQDVAHIDSAAVMVDGDTAVVSVKGPAPLRVELVRSGGLWKISVGKMLAAQPAEQVQAALESMRALSTAADETAREVRAGRHASIDAAMEAFRKKHAALMVGSSSSGEKPRK